jgi:uncharacterized repeat protein (TIGR01451 family)
MNLGLLALTLPLTAAAPPAPAAPTLPPPMAVPAPVVPRLAPFLFVKVTPPEGAKTTWYPGTTLATPVPSGTVVGLRPGYSYRFAVAGVGETKSETLYPSVEVRGSLIPKPGMNVSEHPLNIVLTDDDVERILGGRYVSKVYFLEDPDQAVNGPVPVGVPLEITAPTEYEAIREARARGRLAAIVRIGERLWTKEELVNQNVPGTIIFPGAKDVPVPACPPVMQYGGIPLYDPLLGPAFPNQECLHDGGDHMRPLGIGRGGKLYGLDPSDTAIEYNTPQGKKFATSNRVCICVPRFAAMRVELVPGANHSSKAPKVEQLLIEQRLIATRVPPEMAAQLKQPIDATGRSRPSAALGEKIPVTRDTFTGHPEAIASLKGTKVVARVNVPEELTVYPGCMLILQKRMDPPNPQKLGEVVTFYLRYENVTTQTMTDVVVSDSLTARLEYVEGTTKTDRPATFTATPNEAGSVVLRWAIDGPLLPGESGIISFKARIR